MFKRIVKQQYENYIDVKSGDLDVSNQLMFTADLSGVAGDNADKIVRGSVISLNSNGQFKLGVSNVSGNEYPMPMFAKKNAFDPDVETGAVGEKTGQILATSLVGGKMTAYVAVGGFELESSEFEQGEGITYTPNLALKANANGQVTPLGATEKATIVGIVSVPPFRSQASFNVYGKGNNRICFWPVFFPNL